MDLFTIRLVTFLGTLGVIWLSVRLLNINLHHLTGHKIAEGLRVRLRGMTRGAAYGSAFMNASASQDILKADATIIGYANSRMLTARLTVSALLGATAGDLVLIWGVTAVIGMPELGMVALPLLGMGYLAMLLFSGIATPKFTAQVVINVALLFIGISLARNTVFELTTQWLDLRQVYVYTSGGIFSMIVGLLLGVLLTATMQNSSLVVILALILSVSYIAPQTTASIAIGGVVGLIFPIARIASKASSTAKRAVVSHAITLVSGAVITVFALWVALSIPFVSRLSPMMITVLTYTFMTTVGVWVASQLTKPCEKLINLLTPNTPQSNKHLVLLSNTHTPDTALSLLEASQEIINHTRRTYKMLSFLREIVCETDPARSEQLYARIVKYEEITARVENEILTYICDIATAHLSVADQAAMKRIIAQNGRVVQIADSIVTLSHILRRVSTADRPLMQAQNELLSTTLLALQKLQYNVITAMENDNAPTPEIEAQSQQIQGAITTYANQYYIYNQTATVEMMTECRHIVKHLTSLLK